MPLPVPPGALSVAHRVCCLRCVRAMKKSGEHTCVFTKSSSKKCEYCTSQNALCVPVSAPNPPRIDLLIWQLPWFVDAEFDTLQEATTPQEVRVAASALDEVVVVASAEAPKSSAAMQFALLEETRALRRSVEEHKEVSNVSRGCFGLGSWLTFWLGHPKFVERWARGVGSGCGGARGWFGGWSACQASSGGGW